MPITVRKKMPKPEDASGPDAAAGNSPEGASGENDAEVLPGEVPPQISAPGGAAKGADTLFGILALLACLLFTVLVFMQFRELSFYTQPPSVFPPA